MTSVPAMHLPVPSQVAAEVFRPITHFCGEQIVIGPYLRHCPAPSQVPSLPQLVVPSSLHLPPGSTPPLGTAVQVPVEPVRLHE